LILGRFKEERFAILEAIKEELRKRNYLPILFDFEGPKSKDTTGTIETLANLSRFIIADLTDPSCIPFEFGMIVKGLRRTPIQSLIQKGNRPFAMFKDMEDTLPWVLPIHEYESKEQLIESIHEAVIQPYKDKVKELRPKD